MNYGNGFINQELTRVKTPWYFYTHFYEFAPAQGGECVIEIKITENGIRMNGHACRRINGQDIVCAAVSALTCNLINSLNHLTDIKIRAETSSGSTVIQWDKMTEQGKLLIDSWFLGMTAINQVHNCILFI